MLTNVGPSGLPLDRIYGMLKFAPGFDKSAAQVKEYVEQFERDGLLEQDGILWKLSKPQ